METEESEQRDFRRHRNMDKNVTIFSIIKKRSFNLEQVRVILHQ